MFAAMAEEPAKFFITAEGLRQLRAELDHLWKVERPRGRTVFTIMAISYKRPAAAPAPSQQHENPENQ